MQRRLRLLLRSDRAKLVRGISQREVQPAPDFTVALVVLHPSAIKRIEQHAKTWQILHSLLTNISGHTVDEHSIGRDSSGKPFLYGKTSIAFNVSHAKHCSLIALSQGKFVGCDIENRFHATDQRLTRSLVLHEIEIHALEGLSDLAADALYKSLWVRKESVLKAIGTGFGTDPRAISAIPGGSIRCDDKVVERMRIHESIPFPGCMAAVASEDARCLWHSIKS